MPSSFHFGRSLTTLALCVSASACALSAMIAPSDQPGDAKVPQTLRTELDFTSIPATSPMRDTARVAGVTGMVAVLGLLNQSAPCFGIASTATRKGALIVLRLTATQVQGTCATLIAGAFDYDVGVTGMPVGSYDVEVFHRVVSNDGRTFEAKVGGKRVEVR